MPTTPPTITASPTPPDPTDRGTYNSRAYAWMTWLKDAVTQIYNVAVNAYDNAVTASNAATTATSAVSGIGSSVTAAATSASNAAASESAALASLNAFKGTYYGAYASDPSLDPLGAAKTVGDLYYNTAVPEMRVWNGSAWVAGYLSDGSFVTLAGAQTVDAKTLTGTPSLNGGAVSGLKEKIINGRMEVSQYNGTSAVTPTTSGYVIDRIKYWVTVGAASKLTFQQVADAPVGFKNSLKVTVATQYSPGAADYSYIVQPIEGINVADLNLGTANASVISATVWIKGSVAGTYACGIANGAANRAYIGTITVTTSWAKQTVLLTGDTSGTWATDNTAGLVFSIDLGSGSNTNTTAGAWQTGFFTRTSGCVTFINQTAGSTLNITGVSLKAGDCRNELYNEWRPYAIEEMLCQRYLPITDLPYNITGPLAFAVGTGTVRIGAPFKVTPRVKPTNLTVSGGSAFTYSSLGTSYAGSGSPTFYDANLDTGYASLNTTGTIPTPGIGTIFTSSGSNAKLLWGGCEL